MKNYDDADDADNNNNNINEVLYTTPTFPPSSQKGVEGCRGKDGAGDGGASQEKNSRSPLVAELHRHLLNTNNDKHSRLTELPELSSKGFAHGDCQKSAFKGPWGCESCTAKFFPLSAAHKL